MKIECEEWFMFFFLYVSKRRLHREHHSYLRNSRKIAQHKQTACAGVRLKTLFSFCRQHNRKKTVSKVKLYHLTAFASFWAQKEIFQRNILTSFILVHYQFFIQWNFATKLFSSEQRRQRASRRSKGRWKVLSTAQDSNHLGFAIRFHNRSIIWLLRCKLEKLLINSSPIH